jgi:hypothetical protein
MGGGYYACYRADLNPVPVFVTQLWHKIISNVVDYQAFAKSFLANIQVCR